MSDIDVESTEAWYYIEIQVGTGLFVGSCCFVLYRVAGEQAMERVLSYLKDESLGLGNQQCNICTFRDGAAVVCCYPDRAVACSWAFSVVISHTGQRLHKRYTVPDIERLLWSQQVCLLNDRIFNRLLADRGLRS